jgi:predicted metalloprotease
MIWKGRQGSSNIEDQRGTKLGGIAAGGGAIGIIITIIVTLISGGNAGDILNNLIAEQQNNVVSYQETAQEAELSDFVSVVLADTEQIWTEVFKADGKVYTPATLVMFTDSVQSACGIAGSVTGPFYCPSDSKIYVDLGFFDELRVRFGAPGDFAIAYVIAHEVGHNVQNLLGVMDQMESLSQQVSQEEYNKYSVRLELQADYLAGVWAYYAEELGYLEKGDLEEALNAASAVGDDRIQKQTQGYVVPDSFTHGTSEQRSRWFYKGYEAGNLDGWDTFSVSDNDL